MDRSTRWPPGRKSIVLGDPARRHVGTPWGRGCPRGKPVLDHGLWKNAPYLLIIAGELSPTIRHGTGPRPCRDIADYVLPENVVIIPGNHDYYSLSLDGDDELRRLAGARRDALFAKREEIRIGTVRIFCCTLWTDFAFNGTPELDARAARQGLNDTIRSRRDGRPGTVASHNPGNPAGDCPPRCIRTTAIGSGIGSRSPHFAGAEGTTLVVTPSRAKPRDSGRPRSTALPLHIHSDLDDLIRDTRPIYLALRGIPHRPLPGGRLARTDVRCVFHRLSVRYG